MEDEEIYKCINYNTKEECKFCDGYGRAAVDTDKCYNSKTIDKLVKEQEIK